ncbi:MAG TPA: hypothetical protein VNL36_08840 [Bacteroidota bacterium]|nr:hypothetical protein [Bacteroidota bacterium]
MKKTVILIGVLLLYFSTVDAQTLTPEQRQQIIAEIASQDPFVRSEAIRQAIRYRIVEAAPVIEEQMWKNKTELYELSLRALEALESPNLFRVAKQLIDSAETHPSSPIINDPLSLRVLATKYLFKFGDYSTAHYVFASLRDTTKRSLSTLAFYLLKPIIQNVPQYADSAKKEALRLVREANLWIDRLNILKDLLDVYGTQMFPEIVYMFVNDPEPNGINRIAAFEMLCTLNYPQLNALLRDRLGKEIGAPYRRTIADTLLTRFGTPSDYQFVLDYQGREPDEITRSLIGYSLKDFVPPRPSASTPVSVLLDSLISYKHQVFALGWLGDKNFVNELDNHLDNAKRHLERRDSLNTAMQVSLFQEKVNREYEHTKEKQGKGLPRDPRFVTIEGWKFLYHHAQYILDRLPKKK